MNLGVGRVKNQRFARRKRSGGKSQVRVQGKKKGERRLAKGTAAGLRRGRHCRAKANGGACPEIIGKPEIRRRGKKKRSQKTPSALTRKGRQKLWQ